MSWEGATPSRNPAERFGSGGVGEVEEPDQTSLRLLGGRISRPGDSGYPRGLHALPAPPTVYLAGAWEHEGPAVAIVGARGASDDGCDVAWLLAGELASRGVAVVSGLAHGIDAAAHRGALDAGGLSGAVLGTGLDRAYPNDHRDLQRTLARSLGLMSELPPGAVPTRSTFASRNRLLAALSDAIVVVQGRERSGALLTADAARRLGRPVGAIPWDCRDPLGAAPHALIRRGSAVLIRHAGDVISLLAPHHRLRTIGDFPSRRAASAEDPSAVFSLDDREARLLAALRERPQPLDRAAARAGLTIAEAGAALAILELNGQARRDPGGAVRRSRRS